MLVTVGRRPNQTLERTATRRMFTFQMIKTVSAEAKLADGGVAHLFLVRPKSGLKHSALFRSVCGSGLVADWLSLSFTSPPRVNMGPS